VLLGYQWRLGQAFMSPTQQGQYESANRAEEVICGPESSAEEQPFASESAIVMNSDMSFAERLDLPYKFQEPSSCGTTGGTIIGKT
jgi:hypothetical protein